LDASKGLIVIDDNAEIMHNTVVIGPCYIGKNTKIKIGAKIYPNCSFGDFCKIGGEIEHSVFQNYSNKQHDGFIGNSFIGEWVNLGAGTNNSDLKNNYSSVSIKLSNKTIPTNRLFLGCCIGDHSKTAINTSLNTGSIIGFCSNIHLTGLTPKFIGSYK
jgi:UDP-N-acetylglucosamine diphosphorylase/glucosamine-1-phosphate N-acetyltransferase